MEAKVGSEIYQTILSASTKCLGALYATLNDKAYQNMFTLLCLNTEVIFELMTDRVRDVREHSCEDFIQ